MGDSTILIVTGVIIFFAVLFLLREVNTWYWKINASISNQEKTNELLDIINLRLKELTSFIKDQKEL